MATFLVPWSDARNSVSSETLSKPKRPTRVAAAWRGIHHTVNPEVFPKFESRATDETLPLVRIALGFVANTLVSIIMKNLSSTVE